MEQKVPLAFASTVPFMMLFATHQQVFDFLILWKFNLLRKSRLLLPAWHLHDLMPSSGVIKGGSLSKAAMLPCVRQAGNQGSMENNGTGG